MLNAMIRYSLAYRWFILAGGVVLLGIAAWTIPRMPLDVFPELNVPTITILTEAPGYAAEEVENAVTFPIETALNGIPGLRRLRSSSTIGLSIVWAEFDFGADIYRNRQLVVERLAQVQDILPENIHPPEMTPVTSISGEIMLVGLTTVDGGVSPLELRRMAEFDLRPRLLAVAGVAQVIAIGGELPEYQIEVSPEALRRFDLTLADVEHATIEAHAPVGGGYLPDVGGRELPLRPLTRAQNLDEIAKTVVGEWRGAPLLLAQVAELRLGGAPRRGTGSADGQPAVILTIQKNPGTNTLALTRHIDEVLDAFARTLPKGVELRPHIFRQADFITVSIQNVLHALRDGVIFVINSSCLLRDS
ncbi:efflux RND transporter permease subunit [Candidatus Entotheonella palauensis]|uniref:efflux RND transporter permease subunit n=1 Tax=Candidatus Entotheonella palauensis TaxID=93172 RepID=UPI001178A537|nr:efflux RND transporter permease subunit [Candidatus Entotheonella palauensis]